MTYRFMLLMHPTKMDLREVMSLVGYMILRAWIAGALPHMVTTGTFSSWMHGVCCLVVGFQRRPMVTVDGDMQMTEDNRNRIRKKR